MSKIYRTLGNKNNLKLYKVAFLCSRRCLASVLLKSYDWAIEQREKGVCVISGFHSKIEKDVLHYLLKGKQPVILVLARGLKKRLEPELKKALDENRLCNANVIMSYFTKVKVSGFITVIIATLKGGQYDGKGHYHYEAEGIKTTAYYSQGIRKEIKTGRSR